jgi:hypothetical protein
MLRRFLNVASVACCISCVAFAGIWVRSYLRWDKVRERLGDSRAFSAESVQGRLIVNEFPLDRDISWQSSMGSGPIEKSMTFWNPHLERNCLSPVGFDAYFSQVGSAVVFPYWLFVLASGLLAMLFQLRWPWRFTLRQLLVVTAFVAAVLGMSAFVDKSWIGQRSDVLVREN